LGGHRSKKAYEPHGDWCPQKAIWEKLGMFGWQEHHNGVGESVQKVYYPSLVIHIGSIS